MSSSLIKRPKSEKARAIKSFSLNCLVFFIFCALFFSRSSVFSVINFMLFCCLLIAFDFCFCLVCRWRLSSEMCWADWPLFNYKPWQRCERAEAIAIAWDNENINKRRSENELQVEFGVWLCYKLIKITRDDRRTSSSENVSIVSWRKKKHRTEGEVEEEWELFDCCGWLESFVLKNLNEFSIKSQT